MSNENKPFDLQQWAQSRPQVYDNEAQYNERVRPLIQALLEECHACGIPAVMTFAYQQDGAATSYETRTHFPSIDRTPPGMLMQLFAARNDQDAMDAVLAANAVRVCMSAITRH